MTVPSLEVCVFMTAILIFPPIIRTFELQISRERDNVQGLPSQIRIPQVFSQQIPKFQEFLSSLSYVKPDLKWALLP